LTRKTFALIFSSIMLLAGFSASAQQPIPEPNWSLAMAREAASQVDAQAALKPLFQLAREGNDEQLLQELAEIEHRSDWPVPAREHVLHAFASGLGDLQAWTISQGVIDVLTSYQPQTLVPLGDHPEVGMPLFNIEAAAVGSANEWRRRSAAASAKSLLDQHAQVWLYAYLAGTPEQRRGYRDGLDSASRDQLLELGELSLKSISKDRSLAAIAAQSALLLSDPGMFQRAISANPGPGLAAVLGKASTTFSDSENLALLEYSIERAPPGNAALAIALLAPTRLDQAEMAELMFKVLDDRKLGSAAAMVLSRSKHPEVHRRLALLAAEKNTLASKRAALAVSNRQAELAGDSE
jgi:hypothetical protein